MRDRYAAWILGSCLLASTAIAAPGEYWEMTNKVEMQGMSMPGMTNKFCMGKGSESDPRQNTDKDCEVTDMKMSGGKSSWKMRCVKNGEVMTGSGEMSGTADRNEGTIKFTSAKTGTMSMSFVNKRIGGACDTEEMKKKIDAQVAASNKEMAKMCEGANTTMEWHARASMIVGKDAMCADKKEQFCSIMKRDVVRDIDVYFALKEPQPPVSQSCGISMDAAKKSICKSVDANSADFNKQLRGNMGSFHAQRLRSECPAEMKVYAELSRKRYCEGRGFTEKQRVSLADCLKGGGSDDDHAMNTPDPDEPALPANNTGNTKKSTVQATNQPSQPEPGKSGISIPGLPGNIPADAVMDGAKKLKNLFGF
jgi:hypothetical protein